MCEIESFIGPQIALGIRKVIRNTTFPRLTTRHSWLRTFRANLSAHLNPLYNVLINNINDTTFNTGDGSEHGGHKVILDYHGDNNVIAGYQTNGNTSTPGSHTANIWIYNLIADNPPLQTFLIINIGLCAFCTREPLYTYSSTEY